MGKLLLLAQHPAVFRILWILSEVWKGDHNDQMSKIHNLEDGEVKDGNC